MSDRTAAIREAQALRRAALQSFPPPRHVVAPPSCERYLDFSAAITQTPQFHNPRFVHHVPAVA